jgi:hypothetical protein
MRCHATARGYDCQIRSVHRIGRDTLRRGH